MKANHVKYTIDFDIPIKMEDFTLDPQSFPDISNLLEHAMKIQLFYYRKSGQPTHTMRAKNIKVQHEINIQDYEI